ncbi:uncharacterized protein A1O9_00573 [Exophiala aquamarina CBS 119918]|uniref:Pre-mRNA-splicing factor SPF27 n=1 Tax=Exophiala aquamarina CBS 119918 TaxID=1182545 RepID=A0A072Q3W3_9EURO|nr:uncharacterized protein A1O9_00573 [Exophiala aquamarina CBS 119918]KEF62600.1 hypothetical protein A1O9_00573 [Exophiala aquamarina CBS 119918]
MSLILQSHESLPYVDGDISDADRATALALITRELPLDHDSTIHPSLGLPPTVNFSEIVLTEINRVAAGEPWHGGIDLTRYEAPDGPASDTSQDAWRQALRNAYVSNMYLSGRHSNLTLLDEYGKNAWLIGNSQLEILLQELEQELARLKVDVENVNKARKAAQENSRGELLGLEETWKRGIGKLLEIQVAEAGLRQLILERKNNTGSLSA